ncbi:zinc-binding alcohol dehydrogenase family protein [Massilia oculi]|uniref:zinc-binding alcohol dehydrogenase family protein n=1 Tax=Massilia oculi TaxID=945844 RepID=UPI0028AB0C88|nr:zinc-binding alcohol dehydrogenase family protein [Massilia oculi]
MMKAAVVNAFGATPLYQDFRDPQAAPGERVIAVRAAPLSPIVRALAAGRHYTSGASAGFAPGIDGVGVDETGRRVYFLFPKAPFGSMAQRSLVADDMVTPVPDTLTDEYAAAIATAGLASWNALSRRARLDGGEVVMVLGATGAAGAMALQVARHFGAGRVIAVGRNAAKLARLDADEIIVLDDGADAALRAHFEAGVDVVLDFVWGEPAARVLAAAAGPVMRSGAPRLRYVQLGNIAGESIALRADLLRSTGLELLGCGIGSIAVKEMVAAAGELLAAAATTRFDVPFASMPLHAIADAWNGDGDVRTILTPQG